MNRLTYRYVAFSMEHDEDGGAMEVASEVDCGPEADAIAVYLTLEDGTSVWVGDYEVDDSELVVSIVNGFNRAARHVEERDETDS